MKDVRFYPKMIVVIGVILAIAGVITLGSGWYINSFVTNELASQNITTPEDASIPNAPVNNIPTALSMADIIQHHAAGIGGGLTYAQMGRFALESGDPAGTNNAAEAVMDAAGNPVANAARETLLTATGLVTSLSLSAMAIGLSYGAILLGIAFILLGIALAVLGYALLGLVTPSMAEQYGIKPVTATK